MTGLRSFATIGATWILSLTLPGGVLAQEPEPPLSAAVEGALPAEPAELPGASTVPGNTGNSTDNPATEPVGNAPIASGAAEAPAAMQSLARIEEIVVTARRREEFLEVVVVVGERHGLRAR